MSGLREPESCTVELSTGSFINVALRPSEVQDVRRRAMGQADYHIDHAGTGALVAVSYPPSELMELPRQKNTGNPHWDERVYVHPEHIVGIYPLDSGPELRTTQVEISPSASGWRAWHQAAAETFKRYGFQR